MRPVYWVGGRVRQNTSSLWGRRGNSLYCSINSYNMGEGRMIRVWFLHSCIPRPSLVICSFILGLPHSSLSLLLGPILWPLLIPCSCLTVYLFPFSGIWEPSLRGKRMERPLPEWKDHSGFFRLYKGIVGLWVPFACSLSGYIYGGR